MQSIIYTQSRTMSNQKDQCQYCCNYYTHLDWHNKCPAQAIIQCLERENEQLKKKIEKDSPKMLELEKKMELLTMELNNTKQELSNRNTEIQTLKKNPKYVFNNETFIDNTVNNTVNIIQQQGIIQIVDKFTDEFHKHILPELYTEQSISSIIKIIDVIKKAPEKQFQNMIKFMSCDLANIEKLNTLITESFMDSLNTHEREKLKHIIQQCNGSIWNINDGVHLLE